MQSVSLRIWTRVAVSISYDDNKYTTDVFMIIDEYVPLNFSTHCHVEFLQGTASFQRK